jgi:hypothetical protein
MYCGVFSRLNLFNCLGKPGCSKYQPKITLGHNNFKEWKKLCIFKLNMMKWTVVVATLFALISCGKTKQEKKKHDTDFVSNVPTQYEWHGAIDRLEGKKIDLYGFIWLDTIEGVMRKGVYPIYERPNCYKCEELKIRLSEDLIIIDLIDTNFIPDSVRPQWRLVKITGMVSRDTVLTEKVERSVYSYPDYENSGYKMITDSLLETKLWDDTHVYIDGVFMSKGHSFMEGYSPFSIIATGIKKYVSVYIKKGNGPNQVDDKTNDLVKDMNGYGLRSVKVRMYGSWKNFNDPEKMKEEGMIFVEAIKRL